MEKSAPITTSVKEILKNLLENRWTGHAKVIWMECITKSIKLLLWKQWKFKRNFEKTIGHGI